MSQKSFNKNSKSSSENSQNPNNAVFSQKNNVNDALFTAPDNRVKVIIVLFAVIFFVILGRLLWLQVFDADHNKKAAIESRTISYKENPKRGTIYDRNGNVLAFSKDAVSIHANPSEIENVAECASKFAEHLGGNSKDYSDLINDKSKKFVYVKRKIEVEQADSLKKENIKGVYFDDDSMRIYPYGRVGGTVVGTCNEDGDGICGLELYYDDILRGSSGQTIKQQGPSGIPIPGGLVQHTDFIDGQDIMISIDIELQQKVEDILIAHNEKLHGEGMHSIVMDPTSGEIYACASLPLLDPSDLKNIPDGATELHCISSTFEPGSTFKIVAASSILENGVLTPDSQIYCPSSIYADGYEVSDAHSRASQTFTFREIIARSSNVGISLATETMGFKPFYDKILRYKLNDKTNIDFPGDTSGYLREFEDWSKIQSYNVTFGQGVTVTPMQLTRFYSALANNGIATTPHFLLRYLQSNKDETYETADIIDNKTMLPDLLSMMRSVVTDGTAKDAEIPGYGVVGKTGTGEVADNHGRYLRGIYYNSFIGFLTNSTKPLVCQVGGEKVPSEAGVSDVFKEIMTFAIERFKIAAKS